MALAPTADQRELAKVVRSFLERHSDPAGVRAAMASPDGFDRTAWQLASDQLGLPSLAIPEAFGGAGYGVRAAAVTFGEAGRSLFCAPLLSGFLASQALALSGDKELALEHLPGLAAGTSLGALAWHRSTVTGEDRLDGEVRFVVDGSVADLIVVATTTGDLYLVDPFSAGVTTTPTETVDPTRRVANLALSGVAARRLGGPDLLQDVLARGSAVLAAEQVGGAERLLELSVAYALQREQFGRQIGGFQAIKHLCADVFVQVEAARSAALHVAWAADESPDELAESASVARAWCSEAYVFAAETAIQVHGGIGFTWEHQAHLHYKRAVVSAALIGTPDEHRERLATRLVETPA